jgi:hypothetical protein
MSETGKSVRLQLRPSLCELAAERTETGALITLVQSVGGRETLRVTVPLDAEWVNYFGQELQAMCPAPPPSSSAE